VAPPSRYLAAVLLTDMVGYSALAQRDEPAALGHAQRLEQLVRATLPAHGGRAVKSLGDGLLVEFPSALEAVACAVAIQKAAAGARGGRPAAAELRIGIHLGDVVRRGDDIVGDAVNIAARVQPLSDPGGICVTQQVYDQVRGKIDVPFAPIGSPKLKNIATPIPLYRVGLPSARPAESGSAATVPRVAILPLVNISGAPKDEFFADGITEELIQTLSRIAGLRVIARTSIMRYKRSEKAPPEIARELGATAVVEGGIQRAGRRVRITARLLDPTTSEALWSEAYDREVEDVFELQSEISRRVAASLEVQILRTEQRALERSFTEDVRAHDLYLRGRHQLNQRTEESLRRALASFRGSLRQDPRFGRAYAGIADAYSTLAWLEFQRPHQAFPRARMAAQKAISLDPGLAEAHASLGFVRFLFDRAWEGAEEEFRTAIRLDPSYPTAHQFYSDLLKATGRLEEAEAEVRRALELDPLSLAINTALGHVLYLSRRYDDAIAQYRRVLELEPEFVQAHLWFGRPYLEKGMFSQAISEVRTAVRLSGGSTMSLAVLGHAFASAGRRNEARQILRRLALRSRLHYVPSYWIGLVYVGLDDRDRAFEWLARAEKERSAWLAWVNVEPRFDRLRGDPRFARLVRRLDLP